jgi:hypothetical protein
MAAAKMITCAGNKTVLYFSNIPRNSSMVKGSFIVASIFVKLEIIC